MKLVKLLLAIWSMFIGSVILIAAYMISTGITVVVYFFWDVWVNLIDALKANTKGFMTSINNNKTDKKN